MSAGGGLPNVGCRINLISNAQIRYEGILAFSDTDRSMVALSKVRSYGTEDRPTTAPPREENYDFIIFRGSDINAVSFSEPPRQHNGVPGGPANVLSATSGSSVAYHPRWISYRDLSLAYNELTAWVQYNAALHLLRSVQMVEQASQTEPLVGVAQKRGTAATQQQGRQFVLPTQRSGQVHKETGPSSKQSQAQSQPSVAKGQDVTDQKRRGRRGRRRPRNRRRGQRLESSEASNLSFESTRCDDDLTEDVFVEEASAEADDRQQEDPPGNKCYDQSRSFFDNFPVDSNPRRTTRAKEIRLNIETFGVPGNFRRASGFRRRGNQGAQGNQGPHGGS